MPFPAKYPGRCVACGDPIAVGESIESAFGKGYAHAEHAAASVAAGVTQRSLTPAPKKKRDGIQVVPDGTVGTCQRCTRIAVVYTVKLTGRKRMQVCTSCHSALIAPLRQ